jgi:diguanylate cyclase (GGDEF)-like protein
VEDKKADGVRDAVTSLYCFEAAKDRMKEMIAEHPEGKYHIALIYLHNYDQIVDEYGEPFTMAIVENGAATLKRDYSPVAESVVLSRMCSDAFMIFQCCDSDTEMEKQCEQVYDDVLHGYYGRKSHIQPRIYCGVYHLETGEKDVVHAVRCAGAAVAYGRDHRCPFVLYGEGMHPDTTNLKMINGRYQSDVGKVPVYDDQFMNFAIGLLSDTRDLNSSIDVLIQRIGWKYEFDNVLISEFSGYNGTIATNKWIAGLGVLPGYEQAGSLNEWEDFFTGYDENGIFVVHDVEKYPFSTKDREFFAQNHIGSFINIFLYKNEHPIGYISCSKKEGVESFDERMMNSLVQLSKVLASFVALRIQDRENQEQLDSLALDELTGLYQYGAFCKEVRQALYDYDSNRVYAMIGADISNFSYLNESFGYNEGNRALKKFARRLKKIDEKSIACHVTADQFAIFVEKATKQEVIDSVQKVDKQFANYLEETYPLSDLRPTFGIYFLKNPNVETFMMMDYANHARKGIKKDHMVEIGIYNQELQLQRRNKLDIVGSIHDAINSGAIEAYLQPKFSLKNRNVIGAEALVRWRNEDGSYKYPNEFIPVLEESGYVVDVDFCIYEQVLALLHKWRKNSKPMIPISVNFSRVHFRNREFVNRVINMAKEYDVNPRYVELEVTETSLADDRDNMYSELAKLRQYGFRIDIDDFGTGYSSLAMLLSAPVDIVKIDKGFLDHSSSEGEKEYINQIGNLVKTTNKEIIFEGVESEEQVRFLVDYGYEKAQGYVFSKPISIEEFERRYVNDRPSSGTDL